MTIRVIARDHILDEGFELEIGEEITAVRLSAEGGVDRLFVAKG
jgi:hypothetical protein